MRVLVEYLLIGSRCKDGIFHGKTSCFGVKDAVSTSQRDSLFEGKTSCFAF